MIASVAADLSAAPPWCNSPMPANPKGDLMFKRQVWDHLSFDMEHYCEKMVTLMWLATILRTNWSSFKCHSLPNGLSDNIPRGIIPALTQTINKAGWTHAFLLFLPNSNTNFQAIRPGKIFLIYCTLLVDLCEFLADRSGTQCGLLLL